MTLSGFKFIFFWEWVHRLLGRILGLVFFVGVGWFAVRARRSPAATAGGSSRLFVLGGLQGAVGWFMVMSGLEGRTEVSPYRLSAHLLFALFLFSALIWTALDLRRSRDPSATGAADRLGRARACHAVHPADARRLGRGLPRRLCLQHLAAT